MNEENLKFTPVYDILRGICNPTEKLVFGEIKRLSYQDGYSHAGERRLSKNTGYDVKTIHKAILKLLEMGLIVDVTDQNEEGFKEKYYARTGEMPVMKRYGHKLRLLSPNMNRISELIQEKKEKAFSKNIRDHETEEDMELSEDLEISWE